MALQPPSYPNPFDPSRPEPAAYARIGTVMLRPETGAGNMVVNVKASAAARAAKAPPIDQVAVSLGMDVPGTDPPVRVKTLTELMADPEFAAAYAVVAGKLYGELRKFPAFRDAADV